MADLIPAPALKRTEGYLNKKGGAVNYSGIASRRNWKKRWFILTPEIISSQRMYSLKYYDSQGGKLKGSVNLLGTRVEEAAISKHVKYEFQIILQNGVTFQLGCDDVEERDEWVESLNKVLAYMTNPEEHADKQVSSITDFCGYNQFDVDDPEMHAVRIF